MYRLIENIKREAISNRWANKKGAQFEYNIKYNHYRLIELTSDLQSYLVGRTQRNDSNCPIIAKGLTAYLIRNWSKSEQLIFDSYYNTCLNKYKQVEQRKPGSSMRDLDREFYPLHISQEKEFAKFSEQILPYLSSDEVELINQFAEAYFKYIQQVYSHVDTDEENSAESKAESELSVPEWCIVFYYLDEAGTKQGHKINRIEKFIEDNKVVNPTGELTTPANFRKEYYEIENRINGKNDKKPLPPERIENILPYLKKNKEAMQNAVNDIGYLNDEIEENERNTY